MSYEVGSLINSIPDIDINNCNILQLLRNKPIKVTSIWNLGKEIGIHIKEIRRNEGIST